MDRNINDQKILMEWVKSTQEELRQLQHTLTASMSKNDQHLTSTLQHSYHELNQRLEKTATTIAQLKEETGKFSEIGRSMSDLAQLLQSPKLRGNLGEQILHDLLAQNLPKQAFYIQHKFLSGETVDCALKTQAGLIPIDAKFPLDNYLKYTQINSQIEKNKLYNQMQKDIKKHIETISLKYIKTSEKTVDFALMYIPAESIYYELMTNMPQIYDYSLKKRVLPVSPSTFYAFLRTVLLSFEGQQLAHKSQEILSNLRDIQHRSEVFGQRLDTLQRHINHSYANMNEVSGEFIKLKTLIKSNSAVNLSNSDSLLDFTQKEP